MNRQLTYCTGSPAEIAREVIYPKESHNPVGGQWAYDTRDALAAERFTELVRTLTSRHFTSLNRMTVNQISQQ